MNSRVMLVTGASSGIGRALCRIASAAGYAIFAVGRQEETLASLEREIGEGGGAIATHRADVSDPASAAAIVAAALARFARIDVLVNNAGEVATGALIAQTDAAIARQFGTHVVGPLALTREALPALRESRGAVFMLGSGVARVPIGGFGAYPASKAALRSATAVLRRELRPLGVSVTYVDPGAVDTSFMTRAGMASAPQFLLAAPEQVARAILAGIISRPRELNGVPYQTAVVALAERFPRLTDFLLSRVPSLVGGAVGPTATSAPAPIATPPSMPSVPASVTVKPPFPAPEDGIVPEQPPTFDAALEPLARRMERLKLPSRFVADALITGETLELNEVAMRWAGMPNKNERALTADVLAALEEAGFLENTGNDRWNVVRAP